MQMPIYLDYAATTPCLPEVVATLLPFFTDHFGNAASGTHAYGWQAKAAVDMGIAQIAAALGAEPEEIVITSGATEACNLAIRGAAHAYRSKGNHIITTAVEHKAVLDTCRTLKKEGAAVTFLNVDEDGLIDLAELEESIQANTVLICVQMANNETGVLQDIAAIGAIAKKHGVLFFTDATQAVGKIPLDVQQLQADLLCCSAHKIYGPKGIGALYVRRKNPRVHLVPEITGGGHQKNRRSGTLNVPAIAGFGKAMTLCTQSLHHIPALQQQLEAAILQIPGSQVNGLQCPRVPGITNISFDGVLSSRLLVALHKDIAVSAGSACSSGSLDPSFVLMAMGLTPEMAKSAIRISLGAMTTEQDILIAVQAIESAVATLRQ